jgi:hypothetical protein
VICCKVANIPKQIWRNWLKSRKISNNESWHVGHESDPGYEEVSKHEMKLN